MTEASAPALFCRSAMALARDLHARHTHDHGVTISVTVWGQRKRLEVWDIEEIAASYIRLVPC
jgi:hypothetical protein